METKGSEFLHVPLAQSDIPASLQHNNLGFSGEHGEASLMVGLHDPRDFFPISWSSDSVSEGFLGLSAPLQGERVAPKG